MYEKAIKSGQIRKGMSFNQRVWALCARLPRGRVTTYGQIASKLHTRAARAVGNALNRNPFAPDVPCHRVVGADGSLTGFAGGLPKKKKMLAHEGVTFIDGKIDMEKHLISP